MSDLTRRAAAAKMAGEIREAATKVEDELDDIVDVDSAEDMCCAVMDLSVSIAKLEEALNDLHSELQRREL